MSPVSKVRLSAVALSAGMTFFKPVLNLQISSPINAAWSENSRSVADTSLCFSLAPHSTTVSHEGREHAAIPQLTPLLFYDQWDYSAGNRYGR